MSSDKMEETNEACGMWRALLPPACCMSNPSLNL